jgi:hypothetical protein
MLGSQNGRIPVDPLGTDGKVIGFRVEAYDQECIGVVPELGIANAAHQQSTPFDHLYFTADERGSQSDNLSLRVSPHGNLILASTV